MPREAPGTCPHQALRAAYRHCASPQPSMGRDGKAVLRRSHLRGGSVWELQRPDVSEMRRLAKPAPSQGHPHGFPRTFRSRYAPSAGVSDPGTRGTRKAGALRKAARVRRRRVFVEGRRNGTRHVRRAVRRSVDHPAQRVWPDRPTHHARLRLLRRGTVAVVGRAGTGGRGGEGQGCGSRDSAGEAARPHGGGSGDRRAHHAGADPAPRRPFRDRSRWPHHRRRCGRQRCAAAGRFPRPQRPSASDFSIPRPTKPRER